MVEHKTDSGHTIGKEFPDQMELTKNTTALIQKINASNVSAEEKKAAIAGLKGITREDMKKVVGATPQDVVDEIIANLALQDKEYS